MSTDFDDFMTDTVLIEPMLSRTNFGTPVYGPSVAYSARVDAQNRQVVDDRGEERLSKGRVYIMGNPAIKPEDRIQLPAGFIPQNPQIVGVNRFTDEEGPHHVEIDLG